MRFFPLALWAVALVGCTTAKPSGAAWDMRNLLGNDDGRLEGEIAFPNMHHESVVRFSLPPGEHRLARLWVRIASTGSLRLTVYDSSALESPGEVLYETTRSFGPADVSGAADARWWTANLSSLGARRGVLWVGFKKVEGDPKIWASRTTSEDYFVRNNDPSAPLELLPVRRTPLVRLELQP